MIEFYGIDYKNDRILLGKINPEDLTDYELVDYVTEVDGLVKYDGMFYEKPNEKVLKLGDNYICRRVGFA